MLEYSGMDFPLNRQLHTHKAIPIAGTGNCEWYFTNDAVWIDVSGRFVSQKEPEYDQPVWLGFLKLLRKKRSRRPVNGILVTLNCEQLIHEDEQYLKNYAQNIRTRMTEIRRLLGIDVPVYLILTQADKLTGFTETFDALTTEEREQIFGISFKTRQAAAEEQSIRHELKTLADTLNIQTVRRVHMERNMKARAAIVRFPQQVSQLIPALVSFVSHAFTSSRYHEGSYMRGIYFTSTPEDIARLDRNVSDLNFPLMLTEQQESGESLPAKPVRGNGFFIRQLLEDFIVSESGIAVIESHYAAKIRWSNRFIYISAVTGVLTVSGLWSLAFINNTHQLQKLQDSFDLYQDNLTRLSPVDDTASTLSILDTLYNATMLYADHSDSVIAKDLWLNRMNEAEPAVRARYISELRKQLLPRVQLQLEEQILTSKNNRDFLFQALRAYLMLKEQQYLNKDYLKNWLALDWSYRYSGNSEVQSALNEHFARLLEAGFKPLPLSDKIIASARQLLRKTSLTTLIYQEIKQDSFGQHLPGFKMAEVLSPQYHIFDQDDYTIPGLYTQKGYLTVFLTQGLKRVKTEVQQNWVLGTATDLSEMDLKKLYREVVDLYFKDYMNYWTQAVNKLVIAPPATLEEASVQLSGISSGAEPFVRILTAIRRNTTFLDQSSMVKKAGEKSGLLPADGSKLAKIAAGGMSLAMQEMTEDNSARKAIAKRFNELNLLLPDGEKPVTSLQTMHDAVNGMQSELLAMLNSVNPAEEVYKFARAHMTGSNSQFKAIKEAARKLPEPLKSWLLSLSDNIWRLTLKETRHYIRQQYKDKIWFRYQNTIQARYPFAYNHKSVAIADFNQFFRQNGVLHGFWSKLLSPFAAFNLQGISEYRKDGRALGLSDTFWQALTDARRIQQAFFKSNAATAGIRFRLEPQHLGNNLLEANLKVGDKILNYEHGPVMGMDFKWPLPSDSSPVRLSVKDLFDKQVNLAVFNDPWSLFRLFEQFSVSEYQSSRVLILKLKQAKAPYLSYKLTAETEINPFSQNLLEKFSLPQNL